nr:MAG TPA: hypothetical protein [Caudoviricetes sp.]
MTLSSILYIIILEINNIYTLRGGDTRTRAHTYAHEERPDL